MRSSSKNSLSGTKLAALLLCLVSFHFLPGQQKAPERTAAYDHAEAMVRAGRWKEGLSALLPLAKQYPSDTKILNLTGLALTGDGRVQEANQYYLKALKIQPRFLPSLKNLGINEFGMRDDVNAEKHLSQALEVSPRDPVTQLFLGRLAYSRQDFTRAAKMLTNAGTLVFRDPNVTAQLVVSQLQDGQRDAATALLSRLTPGSLDEAMQFALGAALLQSGFAESAIAFLDAVHKSRPDSEAVGFDLTLGYLQAKQYDRAISTATDLIGRGHESSELNDLIAEAYEGANQPQAAINAFRRAIALDPKDENNYIDFASLCIDHRAYAEALKVLGVGIQVHPESDRMVFERGIVYAMQDHFTDAERDFQLASEMAPRTSHGTIGLGVAYLETGNAHDAIVLLRKKLREDPQNASLLYLLGEALLRAAATPGQPEYAEAQQSLEHAVQRDPSLKLAHVALGKIYLAANRNADAVTQLELARRIDPKERSSYSHLAIAYRRLGELDKAKEALNTLREINDRERGAVLVKPANPESAPKNP